MSFKNQENMKEDKKLLENFKLYKIINNSNFISYTSIIDILFF